MRAVALLTAIAAVWLAGCERGPSPSAAEENAVVVYTSLDRQFAETILDDFTRQTKIEVRPVFDTESTKTVGLTNKIRAEAARPRCDVFWNNEIVNTLCLKREGLLQPSHPPHAEQYDAKWRDAESYWFGFAARARVLIVNTTLVPTERMPVSIFGLTKPEWSGKTGMARPLFGTTASHIACLHASLGGEKLREFFSSLKTNRVALLGGNKACAESVGSGRLAFALTDTDDAIEEVDAGHPVRIVFPDAAAGGLGTLVFPNTLAVVRGAPHPHAAEKLIDFLLSAEVEAKLAAGPSAQIPLNRNTTAVSRVGKLSDLRLMPANLSKAAEDFDAAARLVEQELPE